MEPQPIPDIFAAALAIESAQERKKYLGEACGEDAALRDEVEALLRAHRNAGSFFADGMESTKTVQRTAADSAAGSIIGPYKLLQQIGEGGMGSVWMAEQESPVRRMVALKIIKAGMDSKEVIARFEAERQALALMSHPNIAKVLDAGTTKNGRPYFVMELVKGIPITKFCDKNKFSPQQRLKLFIDVCRAIQHAHQKAIIHRDIKPSNVLVTLHDGVPVVKVIDFGLAKATSQKLTERTLFTAYGQMVGTPTYMSPEQAEMSGLDVDTRTDVYSLGVLLYELMTGTTPIDSKSLREAGFAEIQRLIQQEEAPRMSTRLSSLGGSSTAVCGNRGSNPNRLLQLFRGDLDVIAAKSLEKDRSRRYRTASDFADDIQRFLNNEAVEARPASTVYRLKKTYQRNRVAVLTAAGVACVLILATIFSGLQAIRASMAARELMVEQQKTLAAFQKAEAAHEREERQRRQAEENFALAEEARAVAEEKRTAAVAAQKAAEAAEERERRLLYASDMQLVAQLWRDKRATAAEVRERLANHIPKENEFDRRGFEWYYHDHLFEHRATIFRDIPIPYWFLSSGELVGIHPKGLVKRWGLRSQRETASAVRWPETAYVHSELSRDGTRVALALPERDTIRITNTTDGRLIQEIFVADRLNTMAFSSDGGTLVTVSGGLKQMTWWDVAEGTKRASIDTGDQQGVVKLAVSKNASVVGATGYGGSLGHMVSVFRLAPAQQASRSRPIFTGVGDTLRQIAISPDGRLLASSYAGPKSSVMSTDTLEKIAETVHASAVSDLLFSSDNSRLITATSDGIIDVWGDARDLTASDITLKGHQGRVDYLSLSRDENRLVSYSAEDRTTRVWNLHEPFEAIGRLGPAKRLGTAVASTGAIYSPDGLLVALTDGRRVLLADPTTGEIVSTLKDDGAVRDSVQSIAFSPDGRTIAAGYGHKNPDFAMSHIQLWNIDTGEQFARLPGLAKPDKPLANGWTLAVGALAFSPDGQYLVAGFGGRQFFGGRRNYPIKVFDVATGDEAQLLEGHVGHCVSLAFTANGEFLASGSYDGTARIWNTRSWKQLHMVHARKFTKRSPAVRDVAFSPGQSLLALATSGGDIVLWDYGAGKTALLSGQAAGVSALAFSPDGRTLASGSRDQFLRLWNVETRRQVARLPSGNIWSLAFSPDGRQLLSHSYGGDSKVWSSRPPLWEEPPRGIEALKALADSSVDFQSRIRMLSENLRLHESLAALRKARPDDLEVQAALAATRANWHASREEWKDAVAEFDRVVALNDDSSADWLRTPGLLRLATALLHQGRPAEAAELLAGGANRRFHDGLATVDKKIGIGLSATLDNGVIRIEHISQSSPAARSSLQTGDAILKVGSANRPDEILNRLDELANGDTASVVWMTVKHAGSDNDEEIELTCELHLADPATGDLLIPLQDTIDQRLAESPRDAGLLELRAAVAGQWSGFEEQIADYSRSIEILSQTASIDSSDGLARLYRRQGDLHVRLEQWQRAADDYEKLINAETTDEDLLINHARSVAEVKLEKGDMNGAVAVLSKAINRFPETTLELRSMRFEIYVRIGESELATKDYKILAEHFPAARI